ncbi:GTP-binding protein [Actinoplanes sp. TRM 88003]|uniref:GTP-binding protein n=1 Tax=Paractinoplanes aksuensis TaxID=2939490 RepID=A0ABT1DSF9_9ACTN|nr:GTP-binding protein [Actinoplanes aksuensis]MCO8273764.1 GTP-binding protein [Actinoplanes aksuensis]
MGGLPVLVLCGFWGAAVAEVAGRVRAEHPGVRVMVAPEGAEPDQLRTAEAPHIVTVVPADLLLDGLADERPVSQLVARQLEQADTVLLTGQPEGDDEWEAEQLRVLVQRIAPWARQAGVDDLIPYAPGRTTPVAAVTRGLRGRPVGVHHPVGDHGVVACVFQARRPFHPGRLHESLPELTDGVLRSRGTCWRADRPDVVMTWESAGTLRLRPWGRWLAADPGDSDPERSLAAAVDWHPYYDDRGQHLAFIGLDLDPVRLHRTLTRCLLTDPELADGWDSWSDLLLATKEKPQ